MSLRVQIAEEYFIETIKLTSSGFFLHFLAYFILTFSSYLSFNRKNKLLIIIIIYSLLLECLQYYVPTRTFNIYDITANIIGIVSIDIIYQIKNYRIRSLANK